MRLVLSLFLSIKPPCCFCHDPFFVSSSCSSSFRSSFLLFLLTEVFGDRNGANRAVSCPRYIANSWKCLNWTLSLVFLIRNDDIISGSEPTRRCVRPGSRLLRGRFHIEGAKRRPPAATHSLCVCVTAAQERTALPSVRAAPELKNNNNLGSTRCDDTSARPMGENVVESGKKFLPVCTAVGHDAAVTRTRCPTVLGRCGFFCSLQCYIVHPSCGYCPSKPAGKWRQTGKTLPSLSLSNFRHLCARCARGRLALRPKPRWQRRELRSM